jgi:hypothetical protein
MCEMTNPTARAACAEAHHLIHVHEQDRAVGRRRRIPHADGLTGKAPLAEELPWAQHRHHRLPAGLREHREFHAALLDVQDMLTRVALGEDDRRSPILDDPSVEPG